MSIDFTPKIFSRRHYLLPNEDTKGVVSIDPVSQYLGYKLLPSNISNRLLIGNKIDHTVSQCDFFHEDMNLIWFTALPNNIVLEYLPGQNYSSMTYYIIDKSYTVFAAENTVRINGYVKIMNNSILDPLVSIVFSGISIYNEIFTTAQQTLFIQTGGNKYLNVTVILDECQIVGVTTSTSNYKQIVQFDGKAPRCILNNCSVILRQSVTGGVLEDRPMFMCNDIFESELTIMNCKCDFEITDNTIQRFFLFHDNSACVSQTLPIRLVGNVVTWKLNVGTFTFITGIILSDATNFGRDFYISDNLFKLQKMYNAASTIEMVVFRETNSVSNFLLSNNTFSVYDLVSTTKIIINDIIVPGTSIYRMYDNIFETRDNLSPVYQRGGTNLRLFLYDKFGDNTRSYNQFINDFSGFAYNRMLLQPSAVGIPVIWDGLTNDLYYQASSERVKKNIRPIAINASEIIDSINIKEWDDIYTSKPSVSFIIEEINESNMSQKIKDILLFYNEEHQPISFNSEAILFLLVQNVQDINQKIKFLMKRK